MTIGNELFFVKLFGGWNGGFSFSMFGLLKSRLIIPSSCLRASKPKYLLNEKFGQNLNAM